MNGRAPKLSATGSQFVPITKDQPNLRDFIKGAWENRDPKRSYLNILRGMGNP